MISRSIKEGFHGVGRHFAMALSSAIAITVTLLLISIFSLVMMNINNFTQNVEEGMEISVQVSWDHDSKEEEDALRQQIAALDGVKNIKFYSKDEEWQFYKDSQSGDTKQSLEEMGLDNPMHDAFYVELEDGTQLQEISSTISKMKGVDEVDYGGTSTEMMVRVMNAIRRGGSILVLGLTILAVFLIQNTIKLTIYARQDEITIERSVGATNHFIRSPFVVEGIIIGVMGTIIPIAATYYGYRYIYQRTGGYIISAVLKLIQPLPMSLYLCVGLLIVGVLVGLIGSYVSVTRYLRWKR